MMDISRKSLDFAGVRVLVIGDVMLDSYWTGSTSRISPEAPVQVVNIAGETHRPGGAANVALNARSLGAEVHLVGFVGDDDNGGVLKSLLEQDDISCHFETVCSAKTITKLRVMARSQQLIRLDFEGAFDHADFSKFQASCEVLAKNCDVVVLSDYAKGTLRNIELLIHMFRSLNKPIVIDPKGLNFDRYKGATILTPNLSEFEDIVGKCDSLVEIEARGLKLCRDLNLSSLLVTLGDKGMLFLKQDGEVLYLEANAKEVFDVTGAGDTVIATFAVALGKGWSANEAIAVSNVAAGIVVSKAGTAAINPDELALGLQADNRHSLKICDEQEIKELVANAQAQGETVVMTNGCFDILHNGHVDYLQKARRFGHILIVAVNSDESVTSLKGHGRPFNELSDRMQMLAALECVTYVTSFEELTPERLIGLIKPDVLVKGADYDLSEIAGAASVLEDGGRVTTVELLSGYSTTGLVKKIRTSLTSE